MKLENANYIHQLFRKYLDDQCSPEEKQLFLKFFESRANEQEIKKFILSEFENSDPDTINNDSATEAGLDTIFKKILKKKSGK